MTLRGKFGRPVTFSYEFQGRTRTIRDEKDLKQCFDCVEEVFKRSEIEEQDTSARTAQLEAFITNMEASKFVQFTRPRKTPGNLSAARAILAPKRVSISDAPELAGKDSDVKKKKLVLTPVDYESKHKWIDAMMHKVGMKGTPEPYAMRGKWDALNRECVETDRQRTLSVSPDEFRRALQRVNAGMSPEQIEWFVDDADHDLAGNILYDRYIRHKKAGLNVGERQQVQDGALLTAEARINDALRSRFRSLQQAFKKLDSDADGALSKSEFKAALERLQIALPPKLAEAIFRRFDSDGDGVIGYAEFLARLKGTLSTHDAPTELSGSNHDALGDLDVSQMLLNAYGTAADAFVELDADRDGRLNRDEVCMYVCVCVCMYVCVNV